MARITWQNVAAPDISSALARASGSADGISEGLSGIADIFKGLDQRQRAQVEREGMARLLGIQSVEDFDAATRNGGIYGALGTPSDMVSAAMLEAIAGRRDQLEQDRTSDLDHTKAAYTHDRNVLGDQRTDAVYDRGEADRLRQEAANQREHERLISGEVLSPEEHLRAAQMGNQDYKQAQAALSAATSMADSPGWQLPAGLQIPTEVSQALEVTQTELGAKNRDLDYVWSTPDKAPARLWFDAQDRPVEKGAAFDSLAANLQIGVDTSDPDVASKVGRSLGAVEAVFGEYTSKGIPANIVAAAMENNLRGSNWLYRNIVGDGSLTIDKDGLDRDLEKFMTPSSRAEMETLGQQYQREKGALASDAVEYDRLIQRYQMALALNSPQATLLAQQLLEFPSRYRTPSGDPKAGDVATELLSTARDKGKKDLSEDLSTTPPKESGQGTPQERADTSRHTIEGWLQSAERMAERGLGYGGAVVAGLEAGVSDLMGTALSPVAPEWSAGWFEHGDQAAATARRLASDGLVHPSSLPARENGPSNDLFERYLQQQEASLPSAPTARMREAMAVLNDPAANPIDKMVAEAIVKRWQEAQMGNGE